MIDPSRELLMHVGAGACAGAVGGFAAAHVLTFGLPPALHFVVQFAAVALGAREGAAYAWRRWYG